ncbi:type I-G CRISPR-associated RAMP protein Csb1/Cas7g [Corynebacterium cystitidis]|uniref:type I-G CRISPR-associated RAMP protein Csb1/Cas7g n=1 Tax=Corynebacterium cystitidis TaxID=35757 RepID=UPI00211F4225|nr:type I-U CRISPR-associated RAMP protein Csb1/Cas7u [Corynebacterium cystitidis]
MLNYQDLLDACSRGGASVLTSVTEMEPAAGPHASVAPAKFVERSNSVFAFETRYIDGEPQTIALLDSKQSSLNRAEQAIQQDIDAGFAPISQVPRIVVDYGEGGQLTDMELPHRFADGHIRAGTIDGEPATKNDSYRAVRNSTQRNITALVQTAPAAAVFGGWDSTRATNQLRLPSALVGEVIGVLADQDATGEEQQSKRGGARVDSLAMSVKVTGPQMKELLDAQREELSPTNVGKIEKEIKSAKKGTISAASLGLGGIPPSLESLGGVSCKRIIRTWVLSFAALRQLRFGGSYEQDVAGRALLAAFGLAAMARAEEENYLRANCHLVEKSAPQVILDQRHGESKEFGALTVAEADKLLATAIEEARKLRVVDWSGQILEVQGNPIVLGGAVEEAEDE